MKSYLIEKQLNIYYVFILFPWRFST